MLAMFLGIFEIGLMMTDYMRLTYVVQGAAQVGAAAKNPVPGLAWAAPLLPGVMVSGSVTGCGVSITGQWPVSFGVLGTITMSQTACWLLPS
jgi:hypothetical protein